MVVTNLYIGIDLGTSAVKLLLVDEEGKIVKTVTKDYPLSFPQPGWSEQNPTDWWKAERRLRASTQGLSSASRQ